MKNSYDYCNALQPENDKASALQQFTFDISIDSMWLFQKKTQYATMLSN